VCPSQSATTAAQIEWAEQPGRTDPDLVERNFTADAPGHKMVGDITYVSTGEGWLYLATLIDCHTSGVVGRAKDDNYKTSLIESRDRHHSRESRPHRRRNLSLRQGSSSYTSAQFAASSTNNNLRQSVGRAGICYDNAKAESFFGALTNEHTAEHPTREHAGRNIAHYVELRSNARRRHSGLDYRTPQQAYDDYLEAQSAA
jgi:transposase InsO family protein